MPDLFTGPLDQITLADVEQFLNLQGPENSRPIEGPTLDFKLDAPQDLGNDIAALANSYGGLLILGVSTRKTQKNIPDNLPGTDLGNDPRAKLANPPNFVNGTSSPRI